MLKRHRLRPIVGAVALAALLAAALLLPIPRVGDPGQERVVAAVHSRLPGWSVLRVTDTWEGAYAVVAGCGARQIGFQFVPGHGLPPNDAWIQPNDEFARSRLQEVSDYSTVLVWRARPLVDRSLSCRQELARSAQGYDGGLGSQPID